MRRKLAQHSISGVFVFALLGVFAVFATVMVLFGVKAYKATAERAGVHNASRIASAYLRSMLRSDDEAEAVRLETLDGVDTLSLLNVYDGDEYATRIYVWDGMLYEWFMEAAEPFSPEDGETVCEAEAMTVSAEDGLLTVRVLTGDEWHEVYCALRAARPGGVEP